MKVSIIAQAICIFLGSVTATPVELAARAYQVNVVEPANPEVLNTTAAQSCTFQAWSGSHCDGAAGNLISLSSSRGALSRCIDTRDRHSYLVWSGCPTGVTYLCEQTGCPSSCTYVYAHSQGQAVCVTVNIGTNWQSAQVKNNS